MIFSKEKKRKKLIWEGQAYNFGTPYALVTLGTIIAYTGYTVTTTAWRTKFRKQANAADNIAASKAVDSLINFEAVKVNHNSSIMPMHLFTKYIYIYIVF